MLPPDELDDLNLSLFNIQQVETVVLTHGEDLPGVDDPDQLDDSTAMMWTVNTTKCTLVNHSYNLLDSC